MNHQRLSSIAISSINTLKDKKFQYFLLSLGNSNKKRMNFQRSCFLVILFLGVRSQLFFLKQGTIRTEQNKPHVENQFTVSQFSFLPLSSTQDVTFYEQIMGFFSRKTDDAYLSDAPDPCSGPRCSFTFFFFLSFYKLVCYRQPCVQTEGTAMHSQNAMQMNAV